MTTDTTALPGTETAAPATEAAAVSTETTTATAAPASEATTETKAADTGTLLTGGETTEKTVTAPADWPTDWREKIAAGDAKELEQLKRHGSPLDLWKKARSLEQKLSSGEYKRELPKDATPEDVAAWRAERGIPDKPDGYLEKLALPDGMVLGEADKPIVASFAEAALDGNMDAGQLSKLVAQYYKMQDQIASQRSQADAEFRQRNEDHMRAELGPDFRPTLGAVNNFLASLPSQFHIQENGKTVTGGMLAAARLPDGTRLGDNAAWLGWLAERSREANPYATLMPAGMGDQGKGVNDEIASIEKLMGDRSSDYWRGPTAEPMQQRYRDLVEARERMKSRAA
jgi:hypothetical protein